MSRSIRGMSLRLLVISAMGLALACGSDEASTPTGMPMGQASPQVQETTPAQHDGPGTPPSIESVALRPESPRPGERLTAVVETSDSQAGEIRLDYRWIVDGVGISATGSELMLRDVSKGSLVTVEVTAHASSGVSEPYEASVTIANRPPVLLGVVLEPLGEVSTTYDVTAVPRSYDPDGDEVTYEYIWRVNGASGYGEGAVLFKNEFRRGDEISLEVVADDGDDLSDPLISDGIKVVNAKPKITSTPSGFGGEKFLYLVKVEDPDKDRRLRFHLVKGPDGMSIDGLSGKLTWAPSGDQEGSFPVEVRVADGHGGEDTQTFELNFGFESEDAPAALAE